jgi:AcrR family transcriptional regulator
VNSPNPERRSERARTAILEAALVLSRDPGFQATSVEAIAKRAGVGKQTIYRWWPSKGAVLLEAINERLGTSLEFPDTGDIVTDLRSQITEVARALASDAYAPVASLVAAAQTDPALAEAMNESLWGPNVIACRERLKKARQAHQIRLDVDLDDVIEQLYGPLYYRFLLRNKPITDQQVTDIVDLTFSGLRPQP